MDAPTTTYYRIVKLFTARNYTFIMIIVHYRIKELHITMHLVLLVYLHITCIDKQP